MRVLAVMGKIGGWMLVLAMPVLGAWVASALAAYLSAPPGIAAACGLLLFPVAPVSWDVLARRRRRGPPARLTAGRRLVLRTLAIDLAFITAILAWRPETVFTALSTRGDWMLDGRAGAWPDRSRAAMHGAVDRLEWLYRWAHTDPYARYASTGRAPAPPAPAARAPAAGAGETSAKDATRTSGPVERPGGPDEEAAVAADVGTAVRSSSPSVPKPEGRERSTGTGASHGSRSAQEPAAAGDRVRIIETRGAPLTIIAEGEPALAFRWPAPPALHPLVRTLPAEVESSFESVARHLSEGEREPLGLLKAIHDYVADRLTYDTAALATGELPSQEPASVFTARKAVCAGYAGLVAAMARTVGMEVEVITGQARTIDGGVGGLGHAWNAAKVEGTWYLIDATWDSGGLEQGTFRKRYRTDYFLTPPEVFIADHLPADPGWQLLPRPISRGDFLRQPMMTASFFAAGLELERPDRSQVTAAGRLEVVVRNRDARELSAVASSGQGDHPAEQRCDARADGPRTSFDCTFSRPGPCRVRLFAGTPGAPAHTPLEFVGQLDVTNQP